MAAIVKANANLTSGGLSVLRRQYSTTDDGTLNYEVEYVCLSQFADDHIKKFRTGAQPPTPIPASMLSLRIDKTPALYDFSTNTQSGLTYFNARYSAASLDAGEVITTESQEQRSFSGTVRARLTTPGNLGSQIVQDVQTSYSFDYISTTVTVEAKNPRALPQIKGRAGIKFNQSIGKINNVTPFIVEFLREAQIETQSTTRSSRGTYTYRKSSSGIYEVTPSIF